MMRSLVNSSLSNGLRLHRKLLMKSSCCSKPGLNGTYLLPRFFSGSSSQSDDTAKVTNFGGSFPDFNSDGKSEGFEQLTFPDAVQPDNVAHVDKTLSAVLDAIPTEAADIAVAVTTELGNHPTHLIMRLIENIHLAADLPYWQTIVVTTIALRIILFPMAIYTIQNASRMPHAKPKIQKLQDEFTNHPDMATDPNLQVEFRRKMTQLLQRENVNPVRGILSPLCQIPIFLSMFFGLKEIGNFLPGMTTGGVLWFTDLTATDAFMIFPVLNALSFLLMIEIGMDGLPPNPDMDRFKIIMRLFALGIIPMTATMPQSVFMYWATNNSISITQSLLMKRKDVKKYFGIMDPPPPDPTQVVVSPFALFQEAFAKHEKKYQEDRLELQRSIKMRQRLQKEAEERAADSLLNPVNTHMSSMNMNINSSSSSRSSGSKSPIVIELQNKKIEK